MHQGDLVLAADAVARRRVGQLRQVLDDPAPPQPAPPLHPLQVDQPDVELAGGRLVDQEVAAVQVAMVVAGLVQPAHDLGHGQHDPPQLRPRRARGRPRRETPPQEGLQFLVAGQFLGDEEGFHQPVGRQPLAVGHQGHDRDAQRGQGAGMAGLGPRRRWGRWRR